MTVAQRAGGTFIPGRAHTQPGGKGWGRGGAGVGGWNPLPSAPTPPQVQHHLRGEDPQGAKGAPTPPGHQQGQRAEGERGLGRTQEGREGPREPLPGHPPHPFARWGVSMKLGSHSSPGASLSLWGAGRQRGTARGCVLTSPSVCSTWCSVCSWPSAPSATSSWSPLSCSSCSPASASSSSR